MNSTKRRPRRDVVLALAAAAALLGAAPAHACEVDLYPGVRVSGITYVAAAATADSAIEGSGVRARAGQVMRVERTVGGMASAPPVAGTRAVFVPHASGADCSPVPWNGSSLWVTPGRRVVIAAFLRPSREWIGGVPTFDVHHADAQPYPGGLPAARWSAPDSILNEDDLLDFISAWPTAEADSADARGAREPLWAWARANPALAALQPARGVLLDRCDDLERRSLRSAPTPFSGIYRVSVRLGQQRPRETLIRVPLHPADIVRSEADEPPPTDCDGGGIRGYTWSIIAGEDASDAQQGALVLLTGSARLDSTARTWRGEIEPPLFARLFPDDTGFARFSRAWQTAMNDVYDRGEVPAPSGMVELLPDGSARICQTTVLEDGTRLTVSAVRIAGAP